jgi:putative ABC transport system permease protein
MSIANDFGHAWRWLARSPAFSAVAILTLGVGIGAVVAIFSVLERVALRPLPYPDADRLVWIESRVPASNPNEVWGLSEAGYFLIQQESRTLEALGATSGVWTQVSVTLSGEHGADRVAAAQVSASMLPLVGPRGCRSTGQRARTDARP